jgi:hypothetical protein
MVEVAVFESAVPSLTFQDTVRVEAVWVGFSEVELNVTASSAASYCATVAVLVSVRTPAVLLATDTGFPGIAVNVSVSPVVKLERPLHPRGLCRRHLQV